MYWSEEDRLPIPKLIPMEKRIDDKNTEIFLEDNSELNKHFEEKRRERVERDGCYLGDPREPTDRPSTVGKEVAICSAGLANPCLSTCGVRRPRSSALVFSGMDSTKDCCIPRSWIRPCSRD